MKIKIDHQHLKDKNGKNGEFHIIIKIFYIIIKIFYFYQKILYFY